MRKLLVVIALFAVTAQADRLTFTDRFRTFDLITSNLGLLLLMARRRDPRT